MHPQAFYLQGITPEQFYDNVRAIVRHEMTQAKLQSPTEATIPPDELLTVPQAAALLDVSVATIHEHKRLGRLIYSKIGGRTYFKRSDLLAAGTREQRTAKPSRTKGKPPN